MDKVLKLLSENARLTDAQMAVMLNMTEAEVAAAVAKLEQEGVVLDVSGDIPKSFVVCDHPYHRQIVYLSQLNSSTLRSRAESKKLEL